MIYSNPVLKGFYPDPSVCRAGDKFYMVCSSFQYFPGVPLFESDDLVNWTQIGHVLTRPEQVMLDKINSSGGVFAPTIRYNDGRFYMVTTNDTTHENFFVFTDDIHGEWSDPISVDQGGIDPSLYFENGRTFFISNGSDDFGDAGVVQCEIDIATGKKLTDSKCIWRGSGGRFLESPHIYKIGDWYYLMAAEGGTEYGHMITCARSRNIRGPFESNPHNPVLTNRNKAPYIIQGIGHGDLIEDKNGDWHILSLGFRQQHIWMTFHHLGREVFLTPVKFGGDGWFTAGRDGTCDEQYEIAGDFEQKPLGCLTFENTNWDIDWAYLRKPVPANYKLCENGAVLHGSDVTLFDADSPTFIALRQRDFDMNMSVNVKLADGKDGSEAGVTVYHTEEDHYDLFLRRTADGCEAVLRLNVGGISQTVKAVKLSGERAVLKVKANSFGYEFSAVDGSDEIHFGGAKTKLLSTEVCGGFTGVMLGIYAVGGTGEFDGFRAEYL